MRDLAIISSRCLFMRVLTPKHAAASSICQEKRQQEASSKVQNFNEFYLLNKNVNDVMEKNQENKRSSSPRFNLVSAKQEASVSTIQSKVPGYHWAKGTQEGKGLSLAVPQGTGHSTGFTL